MPTHPPNLQTKSKIFTGLELLLNSPETPLKKEHRDQFLSAPSKHCSMAAEGKKKAKNEDKERSKARVESLNGV